MPYTDDQRSRAIARYVECHNAAQVSRELAIEERTIQRWIVTAEGDTEHPHASALSAIQKTSDWPAIRAEAAARYLETSRIAEALIRDEFERRQGVPMSDNALRSVAVVYGISGQRAGELLRDDGDTTVTVDARQIFAGLSTDDLRALARASRAVPEE